MEIVVYSIKDCHKCNMIKSWLEIKDIKYKETPFELEEFPHIFVDGKKVEYHTFLRRVREGDIK